MVQREPSLPTIQKDKFTAVYALWYLPFLVASWWGWLRPDWDWERIGLFSSGMYCVAILGALGFNLMLLRWRKVLSILVAPFIAIGPFYLLAKQGVTPNSVRFALTKQTYLDAIEKGDGQGNGPQFRTFVWDDSFTDKSYWTLVFDESDEIDLPAGTQSPAWQQRLKELCSQKKDCISLQPLEDDEYIYVNRLNGHFYLVADEFPNAFP